MDLYKILVCFNAPIKEEQAWAVCHQCGVFLKEQAINENNHSFPCPAGLKSVVFDNDGQVSVNGKLIDDENEVVKNLGLTIFSALDYGLAADEEQLVSHELEHVISCMAGQLLCNDEDADEGYGDNKTSVEDATLDNVVMLCEKHLSSENNANSHYHAVCRALLREAQDLNVFLSKISSANENLQKLSKSGPISSNSSVDKSTDECTGLNFTQWAHLWMQVLDELRRGVTKLKKVENHTKVHVEFELTPYEILMEDIRQRKYTLKKVTSNDRLTMEVKKNAHDIILDFIKSRPTLSPAHERILGPTPPRSKSLHEQLIEQIQENSLSLKHVELTSSKSFNLGSSSSENSVIPLSFSRRKLPKPSTYDDTLSDADIPDSCSDSDVQSLELYESDVTEEFTPFNISSNDSRISSLRSSGTSGVSSTSEDDLSGNTQRPITIKFTDRGRRKRLLPLEMPPSPADSPAERKSSFIATLFSSFRHPSGLRRSQSVAIHPTHCSDDANTKRRSWMSRKMSTQDEDEKHSSPSSTPTRPMSQLRRTFSERRTPLSNSLPPMECLSLTVEEVMHIRQVLSRAQMEKFQSSKDLYQALKNEKICFNCRNKRFGIFAWPNTCQVCKRKVCGKCLRKIRAPTQQYIQTPLFSISPAFTSMKDARYYGFRPSNTSTHISQQETHDHSSETVTSQMWSRGRKMEVCLECHTLIVGVTRTYDLIPPKNAATLQ